MLLFVGVFTCLDVGFGTLAYRYVPDRIDDTLYRCESLLYHHDLEPNVSAWAQWGPLRHRIFTNSLGFKDEAVREVPLRSNAWRIVLIGDSFTEGVGYRFEDTFAGIISARLKPRQIEVLNAGVTSYSPVIYYRKLKYLIEEQSLDVGEVIVFLDISDIEDEARHYTLDEHEHVVDQDPKGRARVHERPRSACHTWKRFIRQHSLSVQVVASLKSRLRAVLNRERTEPRVVEAGPLAAWAETLAIERGNWTHDPKAFEAYGKQGLERASASMDLLYELLRRHGKPLTLVVYPWPNQVAVLDRDSIQVRHWRRWAEVHRVAFVDLFSAFIDSRDPAIVIPEYFIEGDVHFNATGHKRVAEMLLRRLELERRTPWPPPP